MLLKRLTGLLPEGLAACIPVLGIKTSENLLYTPRAQLSNLPIPSRELDELIAHMLQLSAPVSSSGDAPLDSASDGNKAIWGGWGTRGMDGLIGSEWDGVGVIELSGAKRVGKSLLALHASLQTLVADKTAICRWIDTEGSFSAARAGGILQDMQVEDIEGVLRRFIVSPCFQVDSLFEMIADIKQDIEVLPENSDERVKVLVVDPIVTLFKDGLTSTTAQGHAAMVTLMEDIADLTYSRDLLTIITTSAVSSLPSNPLSGFSATNSKPALGTAFTYHIDVSLFIQETGKVFGLVDEGERERTRTALGLRGLVEVLKSKVSPAGRWTVFETDGVKLMDVVPPPLDDERTRMMSAGIQVGPPRALYGPLAQTVIP